MSASKQASKRLGKEYQAILKEPIPYILARPNDANILEWNYIIRNPADEYAGGEYYGTVVFPPDYPFKPPGIKMITPSGRFAPNTHICTSMSNFHPGSWNPSWSCSTILIGLLSFMNSEEITTGSVKTSSAEKKALAASSHAWNITHPKFRTIFPDYSSPVMIDLPDMGAPPTTASATKLVGFLPRSDPTVPNSSTGVVIEPPALPKPPNSPQRFRWLRTGLFYAFIVALLSFLISKFSGN